VPSKDIKKVTLGKNRGIVDNYTILDMDGMADLNVNGRVVKVDDTLSHEEVGWLADQWVQNHQDEDRNLTQYSMKVKRGS